MTRSWLMRAGVVGGLMVCFFRYALPIGMTFTVTNTNPSGMGSLAEAVSSANANAGLDTIDFQAGLSGVITPAATLEITDPVLIQGDTDGDPLTKEISVSGGNARTVFYVNNVAAEFQDLRIINGLGSVAAGFNGGGAILAVGSAAKPLLTVVRVSFEGNNAPFAGAISTQDAGLLASDCIFTDNHATDAGSGGGAIEVFDDQSDAATYRIENSTFSENSNTMPPPSPTGIGGGGAVHFAAQSDTLEIVGCRFDSNTSNGGDGGGAILASAFPAGMGGSFSASLEVIDSLFVNNRAEFDFIGTTGGAITTDGNDSDNEVHTTISGSTFLDNFADASGGAIGVQGAGLDAHLNTLTVRNSTFSGNSAEFAGTINAVHVTMTVDSCTITDNTATGTSPGFGPASGGIEISSNSDGKGTLTVQDTILDGNSNDQIRSYTGFGPASATSLGNNLINGTVDDLPTFVLQMSDISGMGASLAALTPNAKLTGAPLARAPGQTRVPMVASPVINAGATALTVDQRGISRPAGASDDIGAVEVQDDAPTLDLDFSAAGNDFSIMFPGSAVPIADTDVDIAGTVFGKITSAIVTLTNQPDGASESLALTSAGAAAADAAGIHIVAFAGGVLKLQGVASIADYEAALAATRYDNAAGMPDTTDRTLDVVISNDRDSNTAHTTVSFMAPGVDLSVSVGESADPITAGSGMNNLVYTVTLTNNSAAAATGISVDVALTLPSGVSAGTGTPSTGTFMSGTWSIASLAMGSATLTIPLTVGSGAAAGMDVVSASAAITAANETDPEPMNNSDSESTSVTRMVDLSIDVAESIDPVVAGSGADNLIYTVTVHNNGPSDSIDADVMEALTLPAAGVTAGARVLSQGSFMAPTWTVGPIGAGNDATLMIPITVASNAAAGTDVITAEASIVSHSKAATRSGVSTPMDSESTSITRQVDLTIDVAESGDPVIAGSGDDNLVYTVTIHNNGPSDSIDAEVMESLALPAAGVTAGTRVLSQGSYMSPSWTFGPLAAGGDATMTIPITVASNAEAGTDVITAQASIVSQSKSNNKILYGIMGPPSDSESTSIERQVDVVIDVIGSASAVIAGSGDDNLVYSVEVTNNGPSDAESVDVEVSLMLPTIGVSLGMAAADHGSYADPNWTIGALASGVTATLTLPITVASDAEPGVDVISASATITSSSKKSSRDIKLSAQAAMPSDSESTSIERDIDLQVTVAESTDPVVAGSGADNLVYTVTVKNNGPSNASGVEVMETLSLPGGVTPGTRIPSVGSFLAPTWTLGDLTAGSQETLMIPLTVSGSAAAGTDVITAAAQVSAAAESDSNSMNDSASESSSVGTTYALSVTKTDGLSQAEPGDMVSYTIVVSKTGPSDAVGLSVSDNPPSALLNPSWTCVAGGTSSCTAGPVNGDISDMADLRGSDTLTYTLTGQIDATFIGTLENIVDVVGSQDSDSAGDQTAVTSAALLEVEKTIKASDPVIGGTIAYRILIRNLASAPQQDNPGDEFTDILPPQLALQSASVISGGGVVDAVVAANTVTWNGMVPGMGEVELEIVAEILAAAAEGPVSNQAQVSFDADGDGSNESSAMSDDPNRPGGGDATDFLLPELDAIPTLSQWGLILLGVILAGAALIRLRGQG